MASTPPTEYIEAALLPLMPRFWDNARQELQHMQQALAVHDWATLRRLAHGHKGAAAGFGLTGLAAIAKTLEQAARPQTAETAQLHLQHLAQYMETVRVLERK